METIPLLCPGCPRRLAETTRRGVVVWACRDCDGCAVEMARLTEVADRAQIDQLLLRARSAGAAWGKPCPSCLKRGREGRVRDTRRLYELDWCEACQVLWFDATELQSVVPAVESAAGTDVETPAPDETAAEPPTALEAAGEQPRPAPRGARRGAGRRPPKPARKRASGPSSADIVAELVGDLGVRALLALLGGVLDG